MLSDVPLTGSVDLQARRIDDDMSWSIRGSYTQSDVDGALPSAHRAVVGHWEVESHERHDKVWTNHERRSAQAPALKDKQEYILPARFDDTPIPGLPDTVHYIDLKRTSPSDFADIARQKLGNPLCQE